jgi:hypothetical protein
LHDTDDGPLARRGDEALCLVCGSTSNVPADAVTPGERYPGGPPNPEALARPARTRSAGARGSGGKGGGRGGRGGARGGSRTSTRRTRPVEPAADA